MFALSKRVCRATLTPVLLLPPAVSINAAVPESSHLRCPGEASSKLSIKLNLPCGFWDALAFRVTERVVKL